MPQAVITTVASLKRRPVPDGISHPSVGTERDIAEREEARKSLQALRLSRPQLQSLVLSVEDMQKWGYIVAAPEAPGGTEPAIEGKIAKCERCVCYFQVKRREEAAECVYHWGRPYTKMIEGDFRVSCRPATGSDVISSFRTTRADIFLLFEPGRRWRWMCYGNPRLLRI